MRARSGEPALVDDEIFIFKQQTNWGRSQAQIENDLCAITLLMMISLRLESLVHAAATGKQRTWGCSPLDRHASNSRGAASTLFPRSSAFMKIPQRVTFVCGLLRVQVP